jgi:hypothetical protein
LRSVSRVIDLFEAHLDKRLSTGAFLRTVRDNWGVADSPGWLEFETALERFAKSCREHHVAPQLVIFPALVRLDGAYAWRAQHKATEDLCRRCGVTCLDLLQVFESLHSKDMIVHPLDPHPNERAHNLAGRFLAYEFARSRLRDKPRNDQ